MKIIKKLILAIFLLTNSNAFSQIHFESGYWMPKAYIDEMEKNISDKKDENYLKPVTAILIKNNKIFVKTFKDEFKSSDFKYINKNKIYLKSVMISLAVNDRIIADPKSNKYAFAQYHLYRTGKNSMFLIIKDKLKHSDTIQFTKYIDDIPIISDDIARFQIKLIGQYDLYSSNLKKLETGILVKKNGSVYKSKIINAILLRHVPNLYTSVNDFYISSELKLSNLKKEKVIFKFNDSKSIFVYQDNQDHLGKLIYVVKRL